MSVSVPQECMRWAFVQVISGAMIRRNRRGTWMSDDPYAPRPRAGWFTPAAVLSLMFMLVGAASYLLHVTIDPATLPLDQRALYEAEPWWMTGAFGVAVWVGLAGAILLLVRRTLAVPLLLVSLVATVLWFAGFFLVPGLRLNLSSNDLALPAVIVILTWTIFWFARHSAQREWLK